MPLEEAPFFMQFQDKLIALDYLLKTNSRSDGGVIEIKINTEAYDRLKDSISKYVVEPKDGKGFGFGGMEFYGIRITRGEHNGERDTD